MLQFFKQILKSSKNIFLTFGACHIFMDLFTAIQSFAAMRTNIQFCFQENIQNNDDDRQGNVRGEYKCHRCQRIQHQT